MAENGIPALAMQPLQPDLPVSQPQAGAAGDYPIEYSPALGSIAPDARSVDEAGAAQSPPLRACLNVFKISDCVLKLLHAEPRQEHGWVRHPFNSKIM